MTRRTLGTLQVVTLFGAVAVAACLGPLPPDGTAVETRAAALEGSGGTTGTGGTTGAAGTSGPPGRGLAPGGGGTTGTGGTLGGPPAMSLFINAPPSVFMTETSTIVATLQNNFGTATNDVTVTFNLTGSFVLKPIFVSSGPNAPFICAQNISVPGAATVTCHSDSFLFFSQFQLPFTATAEGTISTSISVTAAGVLQASATRQIVVLKADSADLFMQGEPSVRSSSVPMGSHSSGSATAGR